MIVLGVRLRYWLDVAVVLLALTGFLAPIMIFGPRDEPWPLWAWSSVASLGLVLFSVLYLGARTSTNQYLKGDLRDEIVLTIRGVGIDSRVAAAATVASMIVISILVGAIAQVWR